MKKSMLKKMVMLSLVTGALYVPGLAAAEEAAAPQEFVLDEVVVTASMIEQNKFDAHANLDIVSKQEIEKKHYQDTVSILRNVQGVALNDYGQVGHESSSNIRINGSDKVIVLVDGVRINSTNISSYQALKSVPVETIERIEVLKGSASAIYGADAVGGVVNIITKKVDGTKTTVSVAGGSFNNEEYKLYHQGKQGKVSWRVNAKKNHQGSFNDGNGTKIQQSINGETYGVMIKNEFKEGTDLAVGYDYYDGKFSYDDYAYGGGIATGKDKHNTFSVISNQKFSKATSNSLSVKRNQYDYKFADAVNYRSNKVTGWSINDKLVSKLSDKHTLVVGIDYANDDVDYVTGKNGQYTPTKEKITNKAIFLQEHWQMTDKWDLTAGVRRDDHSVAGDATTPRFNLGYKASEKDNVYVAYSRFFVAPDFTKYFGAYGNPNLNAEKGYSWEMGWNHKFDATTEAAMHVFDRRSSDAIAYNYDTESYENLNKQHAKGFDVQFNKQFNHITVKIGYTYNNSIAEENSGRNYNLSGFLPKHAINLGLGYENKDFDASLDVRGNLNRPGSGSYTFPSENVWIADLAMNYKLIKNGKVFARVNNIFDKFYGETSYGLGKPYSMPGRSFVVGMEYSF